MTIRLSKFITKSGKTITLPKDYEFLASDGLYKIDRQKVESAARSIEVDLGINPGNPLYNNVKNQTENNEKVDIRLTGAAFIDGWMKLINALFATDNLKVYDWSEIDLQATLQQTTDTEAVEILKAIMSDL
jgi:hypothetical protein